MTNRITTLFDLDALLAPRAGAQSLRGAPAKAAAPRGRPQKQARGSGARSVAFDRGEPIVLEHDEPTAPVSSAQSLPPLLDMRAAYPFRVESFESDEEATSPDSVELPDPEGEPSALYAKDREATAVDEEEKADRGSGGRFGTSEPRGDDGEQSIAARAESLAARDPAYAAQLAAMERDLKDLAIRTQHPTPEEERASVLGTPRDDDEPASSPPPSPGYAGRGGHAVFDQMAQGMKFANTFALPTVEVKRTFAELNDTLDAQQRAAAARQASADSARDAVLSAAKRRVSGLAISDEELARDVAALTPPPVVPVVPVPAAAPVVREPLASQSASAHLKHFLPHELIISAAEAGRVIQWFWPEVTPGQLGGIGDTDRSFAQALLLEAIDSSADMKIVQDVYDATYMKVFTDFEDVWEVVKTLAKKAYEDGWFTRAKGKITREKVDNLTVYVAVKNTLARNFRSEIKIRVATGEYVGY